MGFCRRCGNIVSASRCVCGGAPVAPVVSWKTRELDRTSQDSWSKTYTAGKRSVSPSRLSADKLGKFDVSNANSGTPDWSSKPFPTNKDLPPSSTSTRNSSAIRNSVSAHIARTTLSGRPPSPLKRSTTVMDSDTDILPSFLPHEPTLSKVYGSILQPKDTLPLHSCAICSTIFPPDATIYPNPSSNNTDTNGFLCKNCFITNGGSKGACPSCSRPVLILKAEGEYVESAGKYWHKACFNCAGCFKNIGNSPMVDLLGRPSCVACFDTCLRRADPTTPKKGSTTSNNNTPTSVAKNPGGFNSDYGRKSRESSPAIEELEQRLGISRSRECSPTVNRSQRLPTNMEGSALSRSPQRKIVSNRVKESQISMDKYLTKSISHPDDPHNAPFAREKCGPSVPSSEDGKQSSSASNVLFPSPRASSNVMDTDKSTASVALTFSKSSTLICQKCTRSIINPRESNQFVTVPGLDENAAPTVYHIDCFQCAVCDGALSEPRQGHATFSKTEMGLCHLQCVPTGTSLRSSTTTKLFQDISAETELISEVLSASSSGNNTILPASRRYDRPVIPSPQKATFPRFGGSGSCPGCQKPVSPMERGVVPGPQGTRWHSSCLVCGGKRSLTASHLLGRPRDERKGDPGCGKKLDSGAKSDGEGGVWCRECLLLVGVGGSPQTSPTRPAPIASQHVARVSKLIPQSTGTTLARQFTGVNSGGDRELIRQLTGGGTGLTRSTSPTKQLRARPKSYYG
ncbi:hypothetical protein CVT24_011542 [Panaeolus cyanescens]|uniref:LIM zinc-binding domain-containing protein n=1 Tax=Panaeolus cyanescens TaxID=181874 RepID=A0A409VM75_9AGAR|nr:hypothetical protein CVT24_011542 [Panaeolus cyanescens]